MPVKKSVKKVPQKDIDATAASVEAAIERLDMKEVEIKIESVVPAEKEKVEDTPVPVEEEAKESVEKENQAPAEEQKAAVEEAKDEEGEAESKKEAETEVKDEETVTSPAESSFSKAFPTEEKKEGGKKSKIIIVICLCIIFTILGFFGGYLYTKNMGTASAPDTFSKDTTAEPSATPTPEEVDLSAYSIEVLNGSGIAGVAGTEQQALETDGFSVENTGNALTQDFSETVIAVTSKVPEEFVKKLKASLSERYTVASDTEDLGSDSTYDVVVTVGSETVVDE